MIKEIKNKAFKEIETVADKESLEQLRIKYLGRKGELTQILRGLKDLPIEERRKLGPLAQKLKKELEELFEEKTEKKSGLLDSSIIQQAAQQENDNVVLQWVKPHLRTFHLPPHLREFASAA